MSFALRPNRIKQRDVWDIICLTHQAVDIKFDLLFQKLEERQVRPETFIQTFSERVSTLTGGVRDFLFEIRRFLPSNVVHNGPGHLEYWSIVRAELEDISHRLMRYVHERA